MNHKEFEVGDYVLIHKISETQKTFGVNKHMVKMQGKKFLIKRKYSSDCIEINGWNWHTGDLRIAKIKSCRIKSEVFKPENLVI